jgi:hypothetical protein
VCTCRHSNTHTQQGPGQQRRSAGVCCQQLKASPEQLGSRGGCMPLLVPHLPSATSHAHAHAHVCAASLPALLSAQQERNKPHDVRRASVLTHAAHPLPFCMCTTPPCRCAADRGHGTAGRHRDAGPQGRCRQGAVLLWGHRGLPLPAPCCARRHPGEDLSGALCPWVWAAFTTDV